MQISPTPAASETTNNEAYDDDEMLELTVLTLPNEVDRTNAFFKALSDCANLHPDLGNDSTDNEMEDPVTFEGARLEGFPAEGGWITAENVDQFRFNNAEDEERGGSITVLGPGAGTIRPRGELSNEVGDENGVNGGGEEAKWRRIG